MNDFHCSNLYEGLNPVDRIAWVLALSTMPAIHRRDESASYRRAHQRLWDIEIHTRAENVRTALSDMRERI